MVWEFLETNIKMSVEMPTTKAEGFVFHLLLDWYKSLQLRLINKPHRNNLAIEKSRFGLHLGKLSLMAYELLKSLMLKHTEMLNLDKMHTLHVHA